MQPPVVGLAVHCRVVQPKVGRGAELDPARMAGKAVLVVLADHRLGEVDNRARELKQAERAPDLRRGASQVDRDQRRVRQCTRNVVEAGQDGRPRRARLGLDLAARHDEGNERVRNPRRAQLAE